MTSCRGILIAGVTNEARTQMAEGFLRALTAQRLFVTSGGVHHRASVHPHAIASMRSVGIDIAGQPVSSLESAMRQRDTYDVYISIDASYRNRRADRFQRLRRVAQEEGRDPCQADHHHRTYEYDDSAAAASPCAAQTWITDTNDAEATSSSYTENASLSNLLVPATPSHWTVATDAADARQRWELWSPRDPSIYYENSTRKFQDHLYEGEPLFARLRHSRLRLAAAVLSQRWEVAEVATAYAMERAAEQRARVDAARNVIAARCVQLLRELEKKYDESLIQDVALAERLCATRDDVALHESGHE